MENGRLRDNCNKVSIVAESYIIYVMNEDCKTAGPQDNQTINGINILVFVIYWRYSSPNFAIISFSSIFAVI